MNSVTLIGTIAREPVYHFTAQGNDLTRLELSPPMASGEEAIVHHCRAWGPAALDLHGHLKPGDRLLVCGELKYRRRQLGGTWVNLPVIEITGYSYLG